MKDQITQTKDQHDPAVGAYIFHDDFLLDNEKARRFYHEYAANMPIIDYHCHLPVQQIAENYQFKNLTDIWLRGDHYKWRAMRALGVAEENITGTASDEQKFQAWAAVVPKTLRNPLFHWTHLELKDPFGIQTYLNSDNAEAVYAHCNTRLQEPAFSARGLLEHYKVKIVCTTDDPCDSLQYHRALRESDFPVQILPAFRPDPVLNIKGGSVFRDYLQRLEAASGSRITSWETLLNALENRIDYFHQQGARLADHGLSCIPVFDPAGEQQAAHTFAGVLQGQDSVAAADADNCIGWILSHLCRMYHQKGWVQQFHLGALRNVNTRKLQTFGADTGFDSIGDYRQGPGLAGLLDQLEQQGALTKTILYNLNPADNELFATIGGNFNEGPGAGKMQYGSAWWYLDQLDGMEKQLNSLSNMGILADFVGMLTDSRSFLSYSRHEYFRRLLCNIFGRDVAAGLLPDDEKWIGGMIQDICYNNAHAYFSWPKKTA